MATQRTHTSRVNVEPEVSGVDSYPSLTSVSKARRILGTLSDTMTDDQVIELIHCLHLLAREQLCYNGSKLNGISYNEDKEVVTGELHQLQRQQAIREADIDIALDVMSDIDKQWLLASPSSRARFQSILFPRGLVYDYEQHRFGTSQISPLYRLVTTKKDSEEPSKSFLVAGAGFGHILRPRNFTIENKFSSEGFLANCHHGSSHLRPDRSQLQPAS